MNDVIYGPRPANAPRIAEELTPIIERLRELAGEVEEHGGDHYALDSAAMDVEQYAAYLES